MYFQYCVIGPGGITVLVAIAVSRPDSPEIFSTLSIHLKPQTYLSLYSISIPYRQVFLMNLYYMLVGSK